MNKGIIFAIGFLAGATAGGAATYFITKNKLEDRAAQEIERYAEYAENKIKNAIEGSKENDDEEYEDVEEDDSDDEPIKKYHHYNPEANGIEGVYNNGIFAKGKSDPDVRKEIDKVTEGEKALKRNPKFDPDRDPMITEIKEDRYNEILSKEPIEGWSTDDLTYLYPQDELYFGYGTDNEELAEDHFGVDRETIMGQTWRWATDYTDGESGVGYIYLENKHLKKLLSIEVVVDLDLEEDE